MLKTDNIASIQQYFLAVGIAVCLILVLIIRFFQLQILDYDQYSKKANTNRIRKVTTSAPRGLILDRNGNILEITYLHIFSMQYQENYQKEMKNFNLLLMLLMLIMMSLLKILKNIIEEDSYQQG